MIEKFKNLDADQEKKVKKLINESEHYDNAIVPVQFDHSLNYFPDMHSWFLYFEQGKLIAVLSVFNPLSHTAEISGCVAPAKRNKGIFNALTKCAFDELSKHKLLSVLFVVDNASKEGISIIKKLNLKCDHIEYLMKHEQFKKEYYPSIHVREADLNDINDFVRINSELFDETKEESENIIKACLNSNDRKLYIAQINNKTIGICTLLYTENKVIIYGLGISKGYQGKGYGYDLTNSILDILKHQNYDIEVELEVDSLNEKAYKLYKKVGFKEIRIVNYYSKGIATTG